MIIKLDNGYRVWTKTAGHGPIKILTLHGGPGCSHEYLECFEDYFPKDQFQIIFYYKLGSYNSDKPEDTTLYVRPLKNKWGSISTKGRMTLNAQLLELPKELGEFVIVHELVHILAPNHGKVFKCFMDAYLPNWLDYEKVLQGTS